MKRLILFLLTSCPFTLRAQNLRTDLQTSLAEFLCAQARSIPTTRMLWQKNIFETQLDAAWIRGADDQAELIESDIMQIARDQAEAKGHLGFAYGLCSHHEAWIVSTPAPSALIQRIDTDLRIDLKAMRSRCEKVGLHYAAATRGEPKELKKISSQSEESLIVHPDLLAPGTIGLTCFPADKKNQGPELWSLVPVQGGSRDSIPYFQSNHREGISGLIQWIQDIRKAQGLRVLQTEIPSLRNFANQLVANRSIRHPHARLLAEKRVLAEKKIILLGENRVKAATNEQMAWLLWYSPTHRQLLLHKSATALGFDMARLQHEKLLVLVLAKI